LSFVYSGCSEHHQRGWLLALRFRRGADGTLQRAGTDLLARRDARSVAVIGAGLQGDHQLRSLHMMRQIGAVRVYDTAPDRALAFAERMHQSLGLTIEVSDSVAAAVEAADMVLAATWARTPFILPGMLQAGTHVSTIGPDEHGKCEKSAVSDGPL
jgi:ornithine cyclodeaminase/alanine dehydrogenase-like protein (mu-crystallin family)